MQQLVKEKQRLSLITTTSIPSSIGRNRAAINGVKPVSYHKHPLPNSAKPAFKTETLPAAQIKIAGGKPRLASLASRRPPFAAKGPKAAARASRAPFRRGPSRRPAEPSERRATGARPARKPFRRHPPTSPARGNTALRSSRPIALGNRAAQPRRHPAQDGGSLVVCHGRRSRSRPPLPGGPAHLGQLLPADGAVADPAERPHPHGAPVADGVLAAAQGHHLQLAAAQHAAARALRNTRLRGRRSRHGVPPPDSTRPPDGPAAPPLLRPTRPCTQPSNRPSPAQRRKPRAPPPRRAVEPEGHASKEERWAVTSGLLADFFSPSCRKAQWGSFGICRECK